jgi:hypothetical protein
MRNIKDAVPFLPTFSGSLEDADKRSQRETSSLLRTSFTASDLSAIVALTTTKTHFRPTSSARARQTGIWDFAVVHRLNLLEFPREPSCVLSVDSCIAGGGGKGKCGYNRPFVPFLFVAQGFCGRISEMSRTIQERPTL